MSSKRKKSRATPLFGVVLLVGATAAYGVGPGDWFEEQAASQLEGAKVKRGPLRISVVEKGNLESANAETIKSEVEARSTILYLIDEGTHVEPGELVCELDVTSMRDRAVEQEISLANASAAYEKAKQSYEIQVSQNESDIAAAERQLEFAIVDKEKYVKGEHPQLVSDREQAIALAEEQLTRDQDRLEWSVRLEEKGFLTRSEREADELTVKRSQFDVDKAQRAQELFDDYEHPRRLRELDADVEEANRELERVKLQAKARLADFEADRTTSKRKHELEQEELEKLEAQLEKGRLYAPVAGMVVYARESRSRYRQSEPISEGTEVYERQEIITIPVTEGMIAEVSLHESVLEKVIEGQSATLTCDALPGRVFTGRVKFKAMLPDQNSWFANDNLRLYRTQVEVLDPIPDMRPGMTCSVEILVDELDDCLQVPVQAVFLDGGEPICFVKNGALIEKRAIETGQSNHKWVEVAAGLAEGEVVLLSRPAGFTLEPAPPADRTDFDPPEFQMPGGDFPHGDFSGMGDRSGAGSRGGAQPTNGGGGDHGKSRPDGGGSWPGGGSSGADHSRAGSGGERGGGERVRGERGGGERGGAERGGDRTRGGGDRGPGGGL